MAFNPLRRPVSKFLLAGYWSPGICRQPTGAAVERNLDERSGYGIDFAFVVFTGRKLARFSTEILLVTDRDYLDYEQFLLLTSDVPRRGAVQQSSNGYDPARAKTIWSPQLIDLDITQCVVAKAHQVTVDKTIGHWPIDFVQVKPTPLPAYARPEAAKDSPPLTGDKAEIARLAAIRDAKRKANEAAGR